MKRLILLIMAIFCLATSLCAQQHWTKVTATDTFSVFGEPYFLDSARGFFYHGVWLYRDILSMNTDPGMLQSTTDGGKTWTSIHYFDSIRAQIAQLYFISKVHGYAATFSGLFETTDFGQSWNKIATSR